MFTAHVSGFETSEAEPITFLTRSSLGSTYKMVFYQPVSETPLSGKVFVAVRAIPPE
jgi:hypothetical protein